MISWKHVLGIVLVGLVSFLGYSYYRLLAFSDNIYHQLAKSGVRSIKVINLIRPQDLVEPEKYWVRQVDNFSSQLLEGVAELPIKVHAQYWVPSGTSSSETENFSLSSAEISEQSRVMSDFRSEGFPSWLSSYPTSPIAYNFLRIWALDSQSDLTFFLDPRTLSDSPDSSNLLHTISLSVRGIGLTKKLFEQLLIPQSEDQANGVLFINKQLILSTKPQPQPDALKRLMLSRLDYSQTIVEQILQRPQNLEQLSLESYLELLTQRTEKYLQKAGLPLREKALMSWICGPSALSEFNMDYSFGDLYTKLLPLSDKKTLKSEESEWSAHLLRETLGPDVDITPLMRAILLEQDLQHISETTSTELLAALQAYRQEGEKALPDNQKKILKEFVL